MAVRYWDLRPLDYLTKELSALWWLYLLQGIGLILLGIAVVLLPELLTILAASFLIAVGSVLLLLAWRVRRVKRGYETFKQQLVES
jgi:uncharacterized membrane protein HdeD (DUF308 family)